MSEYAQINVMDEVTPFFRNVLKNNPTYIRKVSKSVGFWMRQEIKSGVSAGAPGGDSFKKRSPYGKVRSKFDPHAPTAWYGKLRYAVGYEYDNGRVLIGWLSRSAAILGDYLGKGDRVPVTDKTRQRYQAAGVKLRNDTNQIVLPARPIFEPSAVDFYRRTPAYVESKLAEYIAGDVVFSKSSRRDYKVHRR